MSDRVDLFAPDLDDPYRLYHRLRGERAHWDGRLGAWLVPAYADVLAALRDRRLECPVSVPPEELPPHLVAVARELRALSRFRALALMHRNGEGHTRLRHLIQPTFAPAALAALRPHVESLVETLLDRVQDAGRMDVMTELANPLTMATNATLIGIPPRDTERFAGWSIRAFYGWPDVVETADPLQSVRESYACLRHLAAYVGALAEHRRADPADDIVSRLAAAVDRGEITPVEMVVNVAFLFETGRHSTAHFLGTAVLSLLAHPDQLERLRHDPELILSAVEELLRYDPPSVTVGRASLQSFDIGDIRIQAGDQVMPLLGAANRDPGQFPDPDRLDLTRRQGAHLAFGAGPHYCPGAPLGRLESAAAIGGLVRRLPGLRAAPEPPIWRSHPAIRILSSLPVVWDTPPERG